MPSLYNTRLLCPVKEMGDHFLYITQNNSTGNSSIDLKKEEETVIFVEGKKEKMLEVSHQVSQMSDPSWIEAALRVPDYKFGKPDIRNPNYCFEFHLGDFRKLLLMRDTLYSIGGIWCQRQFEKTYLQWEDIEYICSYAKNHNVKQISSKSLTGDWSDKNLARAREGQEPIAYWLTLSGAGLPSYNHPLVMHKAFKSCPIRPFSE